jgi:hypothetical protein
MSSGGGKDDGNGSNGERIPTDGWDDDALDADVAGDADAAADATDAGDSADADVAAADADAAAADAAAADADAADTGDADTGDAETRSSDASDEAEAIALEGAEAALIAASGEFSAQVVAAPGPDASDAEVAAAADAALEPEAIPTDAGDYDESKEGKTHLVLLVLAILTTAILVAVIATTRVWDPNVCASNDDCRGLKQCIEGYCVNPEIWQRENPGRTLPGEGTGP